MKVDNKRRVYRRRIQFRANDEKKSTEKKNERTMHTIYEFRLILALHFYCVCLLYAT